MTSPCSVAPEPNQWLLDLSAGVLQLFLPICVWVVTMALFAVFAARRRSQSSPAGNAAFLLSFAFLGGFSGVIAGASREAIVGALMTGMLGIVSTALAYLFSKDSVKEWRPFIPFGIMLMFASALAGLCIGGVYKAGVERFDRAYKECMLDYEHRYIPLQREREQLLLRAAFPTHNDEQTKASATKGKQAAAADK